jgi:glycosyltransferase involved in cell wall biosynthesis
VKRRLHVAIVCRGCREPGSVPSVALRQAEALHSRFDVSLVSDGFPDREPRGWQPCRVPMPPLSWLRRFSHVPRELAFAVTAHVALGRLHARRRVDALICHSHVVAAVTARLFRLHTGAPCTLVTHGDIFERPRGTYDRLQTLLYRAMTPAAYRDVAAVSALSPAMAELAVRGGARAVDVVVIPNGVALEDIGVRESDAKASDRDGVLKILFVGRLAPEKGVADLLDACLLLRTRGVPVRLEIAGEGPLAADLAARVAAARLADAVTFRGAVERTQLGRAYLGADVVCVPSLSDSLPGVMLEALACGTPVVGTRVGGIPSVVEEGRNGLLVPARNPAALAAALERFASSHDLREGMRARAANSVLPRFSWQETGRRLGTLIEGLAA